MDNKVVQAAMNEPKLSQHLIQIARKHVKLALEHGKDKTSQQRREAIRNEISALRIERDAILNHIQKECPLSIENE
jgi:hypothetical protein